MRHTRAGGVGPSLDVGLRRKRWVGLAAIGLVVLSLVTILWLRHRFSNDAEPDVRTLTNELLDGSTQLYCENGGMGPSFNEPWFEQVLLSEESEAGLAERVADIARAHGYRPEQVLIEDSIDSRNRGLTYWEITGKSERWHLTARVSTGGRTRMTSNNCFNRNVVPMDRPVHPDKARSVLVIQLRDPDA